MMETKSQRVLLASTFISPADLEGGGGGGG